MTSNKVIK